MIVENSSVWKDNLQCLKGHTRLNENKRLGDGKQAKYTVAWTSFCMCLPCNISFIRLLWYSTSCIFSPLMQWNPNVCMT